MKITDKAKAYHEKMFPGYESDFNRTDPEFIERFDNFAFDEVVNHPAAKIDDRIRFISHLAVLLGCQGIDEFKAMLQAAYNFGVTPVEMKEIVYQAVDYLGIGRVLPFLKAVNVFLEEKGIALPLEPQATNTMETRLATGEQTQIAIFGEHMRGYKDKGGPDAQHINEWLVGNCFGDYYTRKGLDYPTRELITFCFLYAQGGCEPQLLGHAKANIGLGNTPEFLIALISNNIPFIGYPRTLNALRIIREAAE